MKMIASAALLAASAPRALIGMPRADASDPKALIEALNKAVAEMRAKNDERLGKIEAKVDPLDVAQIDKINAAVSDLQAALDKQAAQIAAAQLGVGGGKGPVDKEYSDAFTAHFKKGDVQAALNKGTASEGGYLAPVEWDRTITDRLVQVSPMRAICSVQTISTAGFSKLFNNHGATSGWVGEAAARPATNTPAFSSLTFTTGELYANPAATQQMLDDAAINLEAWLAGEVELEFAKQEGLAFLTGNGTDKPQGILNYVTGGTAAAVHPWGAIATVNSGAAAALTTDGIVKLVYALPSEYEQNARFVMNRNTQQAVRLLKDAQNNYIWQPSYQAGQPATLMGRPITEMAGMPDVAASAKAILYGDFKMAYLIIDRQGVRVLRDPFTNKPYVQFYTTKRVGGGLVNPDAVKAQNISA